MGSAPAKVFTVPKGFRVPRRYAAALRRELEHQARAEKRRASSAVKAIRLELTEGLHNIREHALEMRGKTASIYDKTDPIVRTVDALLGRLSAKPTRSSAAAPRDDGLDIGQGEGCEGGKCAVPRGGVRRE